MLSLITFIILLTLVFMSLSWRFDRGIKNRKLRPLKSFPLVSVLIPAFNSSSTIKHTLESVKNSNYPNKEIIVVNDSEDSTPEICRKYNAKIIQNKKRLGKWKALNIAAKHAKGDFLLVLDSDTTIQSNTIKTLVASFKSYESAGESIGVVAPKYKARNKKNLLAKLSDMEQSIHQSLFKTQMNLKSVISIRGCCLLVKNNVFNQVGGFSNTLLEDGDFAAKVIENGYRIKYEPRALVKTKEPETYRDLFKAKARYGKGTVFCLYNHRKTYLKSKQFLLCTFPHLLFIVALIGTLIFHDPISAMPLLLLLSSITFTSGISFSYIIILGMISLVGISIGAAALSEVKTIGLLNTMLPFVFIFIPIATYAYFRGAFAGVSDKIHHRPELVFNDW